MNIDIYYYSGTGNSLYVAREFQKRIPEANLVPIMRLLRRGAINMHFWGKRKFRFWHA
jgi:flavodoxin